MSVYLGGEVQQRETQLAEIDRARSVLAQQNVQLAAQLQTQPQIQYVAVLTDDRQPPPCWSLSTRGKTR